MRFVCWAGLLDIINTDLFFSKNSTQSGSTQIPTLKLNYNLLNTYYFHFKDFSEKHPYVFSDLRTVSQSYPVDSFCEGGVNRQRDFLSRLTCSFFSPVFLSVEAQSLLICSHVNDYLSLISKTFVDS